MITYLNYYYLYDFVCLLDFLGHSQSTTYCKITNGYNKNYYYKH